MSASERCPDCPHLRHEGKCTGYMGDGYAAEIACPCDEHRQAEACGFLIPAHGDYPCVKPKGHERQGGTGIHCSPGDNCAHCEPAPPVEHEPHLNDACFYPVEIIGRTIRPCFAIRYLHEHDHPFTEPPSELRALVACEHPEAAVLEFIDDGTGIFPLVCRSCGVTGEGTFADAVWGQPYRTPGGLTDEEITKAADYLFGPEEKP